MNHSRFSMGLLTLLFATAGSAGCYAEVEPEVPVRVVAPAPAVDVEAYEGFRPMLFDGNVVYYDGYARPYYYLDGRVVFVPRTYVHYDLLVNHYYRYRGVYGGWYARYGVRYRVYHGYRRW